MSEFFKLPRLYADHDLTEGACIPLADGQAHYLNAVLRHKPGDALRLFNGRQGEWLAKIGDLSKKSGTALLQQQIHPQPTEVRRLHLIFAPIKKHRMDWLIEKAVELGATDLHPVLTQNTEVRKINEERLRQQIFEAAEQCERFIIPALHPLEKLETKLAAWPKDTSVLACLERFDARPLAYTPDPVALLIGPEGGFTSEEKERIAATCDPVTLGETVLRCETAAAVGLTLLGYPR